MAGFQGLTFVVQPVVSAAGVLNTSGIVAGTSVIAGILDPAGGINRMYNPSSVGLTFTTGDTAAHWLPIVTSITGSSVNDQYWASTFQSGGQSGATIVNPNTKYGQVQLVLTAATADTVRASSVMNFKLSQNAFVIVATGTF